MQCEGRDESAVMLGLGHTLYEEMVYDGRQLPNANLVDYRVPCALDLPARLFCVFVENGNGAGPFGAQGARRAQSARHTRSEVSGRSRKRSR
jgi:CO/xanthine dehydrogenase Mo-binding subunit